jgi:hypothetical protein
MFIQILQHHGDGLVEVTTRLPLAGLVKRVERGKISYRMARNKKDILTRRARHDVVAAAFC